MSQEERETARRAAQSWRPIKAGFSRAE
jgi:hypothetical protein